MSINCANNPFICISANQESRPTYKTHGVYSLNVNEEQDKDNMH